MKDEAPRTPPGWEGYAGALIRLANADERAVAWFVPQYGGNCAAFLVRVGDEWLPLLHNDGPEELAARPSRYGCPILFPFPGHMRDFQYHWQGRMLTVPRRGSTSPSFTHGFAHTHPWQITETGPNHLTATFATPDGLDPDQQAAYPFTIRLTQTVTLTGDTLRISLHATNEGTAPAPVGLGMHPYFAVDALGGDRTRVQVRLPGRLEHRIAPSSEPPVPTGDKDPITVPVIIPPPLGETALVARTGIEPNAIATLQGDASAPTIIFTLIEGVRDVVYFVPTDQPSISIEPHTCAPGAASQPEGDPDGLVPLEPGASRTMTVAIALNGKSG